MSTAAPRRISITIVLAIAGCGPQVVLEGDATETDAGSTGPVATISATGTPPPHGTSGPVPLPTTGAASMGDVSTSAADAGDVDDGPSSDHDCVIGGPPYGGLSFQCLPFRQDCPRDDQKCMPWANNGGVAWNATCCSPLSPSPAQVGEPCSITGTPTSGIDDCEAGAMCWNVDALGHGTCEDICSADAQDCASPGDRCVITNSGAIPLCLPACDPLAQDCAGTDESCVLAVYWGHWVCMPDGSDAPGAHGDPCDVVNACDPGTVCIGAEYVEAFPGSLPAIDCDSAIGCCTALCDLGDPLADAACAALDPAHTCEPWDDGGVPPGSDPVLGVCRLAR